MSVVEKFLHYVSFDTQSDEHSTSAPSTEKQLLLAKELVKELREIGIENAELDPYGIVYAEIPANDGGKRHSVGLIAHMDTASEMSGKDVHPRIVKQYDGKTIRLNEHYSMDCESYPELEAVVGDDVIVTDGTTLLGADDKAGIAIIMQTVEQLLHVDQEHGKILIAFTPDEEVGRGVVNFDLERFNPDFAYTLDGSDIRDVDYETFNAAMATVTFHGKSIHPGSAKGRMINAAMLAVDFASRLPQWERPEFTEGEEGFFHLLEMHGACEKAELEYLIRDHSREKFEIKKTMLQDIATEMNDLYPECCTVEIRDQYYNMKDAMDPEMKAVKLAKKAIEECGLTPRSLPIRGGTDGAILTWRGLDTPNLGTGGGNYHGRFEFVSINKMEKMVEILSRLLQDDE